MVSFLRFLKFFIKEIIFWFSWRSFFSCWVKNTFKALLKPISKLVNSFTSSLRHQADFLSFCWTAIYFFTDNHWIETETSNFGFTCLMSEFQCNRLFNPCKRVTRSIYKSFLSLNLLTQAMRQMQFTWWSSFLTSLSARLARIMCASLVDSYTFRRKAVIQNCGNTINKISWRNRLKIGCRFKLCHFFRERTLFSLIFFQNFRRTLFHCVDRLL